MSRQISPLQAMKSDPHMAAEINRLCELSMPDLIDEYHQVWGKAPRVKHRAYLWKRIAWKLQERRTGGLSVVAKRRLEQLIGELGIDFGDGTVAGEPAARARRSKPIPAAGASLVRHWKGERLIVRVLDKGFEFEDEIYPSLTAVAKFITGSHCSGPAFFGLTQKGKKKGKNQ